MPGHNPDFFTYHKSLTDEIHSVKNRIRNLVPHWPTDGEYKEVALRSILRRHLPESMLVGRGFIVTQDSESTQIDILVIDRNKPTLFKDGDLMIVTPDAVRAIIEVKTSLRSPSEIKKALIKLGENKKKCKGIKDVWTGLFVYEDQPSQQEKILRCVGEAYKTTESSVNCVCYGKTTFIRYWKNGRHINSKDGPIWHLYQLQNMASAYFVGNLIDSISAVDCETSSFAWFPVAEGKETTRVFYLLQGEEEPKPF